MAAMRTDFVKLYESFWWLYGWLEKKINSSENRLKLNSP